MWWQRKTSIEVKTRDDLVAAIKTAPDEIIIEGDDRLLEEAEKLIAENTQKADEHQVYRDRIFGNAYTQHYDKDYEVRIYTQHKEKTGWAEEKNKKNGGGASRPLSWPTHSRRSLFGSGVKWILKGILFYLFAWLSLIIFHRFFLPTSTSIPPQPLPQPPLLPSPEGGSVNYVSLAWVVAAIVAMALAYRVIMYAIQGERDVEISWKITEKVSGKLVITKVQKTTKVSTRPPRTPKAA